MRDNYAEVKRLLNAAGRLVNEGRLQEADEMVRSTSQYGGTVADIQANLTKEQIRKLRDFSKRRPRRNPEGRYVKVYGDNNVPTDEELAAALNYVMNEFTLKDGGIDSEQWAEGLAFGNPAWAFKSDLYIYLDYVSQMRPQLPESVWEQIGARASYLINEDGHRKWGVRRDWDELHSGRW